MHRLKQRTFRGSSIALSFLLALIGSAPAGALSNEQISAFNSSVYYFNTEVDCGGITSATSTTTGTTNLTGNDNEQKAFNYFVSKGLSTTAAAAAVGNLMEESHFDPTIIQGGGDTKDPSIVTGALTGWGIAQWTPGAKIIGIAQGLHITGPIYELATQLDIVWAEMTGTAPTGYQDVASGLKQQTNLSDATSFFQIHFESGTNFAARYQQAQAAFQLYAASSSQTTPTPGGTTITTTSSNTPGCTAGGTATTGGSVASNKNIVWLDNGPSPEFDGVCDGCRDPKTGFSSHWISGQCSQASLAEVLNAYQQGNSLKGTTYQGLSLAPSTGGTYYKTIDIERVSYKAGTWDGAFLFRPNNTQPNGILSSWQIEASIFHMKVAGYYDTAGTMGANYKIAPDATSLDKMINIANAGNPVIVSAPNHWLVIWGGDAQNVYLLDSSPNFETYATQQTSTSIPPFGGPYNTKDKVSRALFIHGLAKYQNYWGGVEMGTQNASGGQNPIAVVLTP